MKHIHLTNNEGKRKFLKASEMVKLTKKTGIPSPPTPPTPKATTPPPIPSMPSTRLTGNNFLSALKKGKTYLKTPNKSAAAAKTGTPPSKENLSSAIKG